MMGSRGQQEEEGQGRAGQTLAGYLFTGAGNHSKTQHLGTGPKELRGLSKQRFQDRKGVSIQETQRHSESRAIILEAALWPLKSSLTGNSPEKKVKTDSPSLVSPPLSPKQCT